jgi:glycosyltransferase involved in cell wall biosynthesis
MHLGDGRENIAARDGAHARVQRGTVTSRARSPAFSPRRTRDLELLVIDDGSKDDTFAVASACAARDPRVKAITQPNAGIAHTMNRGLELAQSEWVFCMHADDLMMPNRIERQLAFLRDNPDVAVASSLVLYLNDEDDVVGRGRSPFTDPAAVKRAVEKAR